GVPVAAHRVLDLAAPDAGPLRYPLVLKPLAEASATGTVVVDGPAALDAAARDLLAAEPKRRVYVAEEFVHGEEFHLDGYVEGGELGLLSVTHQANILTTVRERGVHRGVVLDPERQRDVYALARPFTQASLCALGLTDGLFHLEAFRDGDGPFVFGECGARPGGFLIPRVVEHKFGVDVHEEGLRMAAGLPRTAPAPAPRREAVGYTHLPLTPGRIVSAPSSEEVMALPGVLFAHVTVGTGSVARARHDSNDRAGDVIAQAADEEELRATMSEVAAWFAARTEALPAPQPEPV
ncbi:MAG TPA: ATP-grasp domain-containing protein, partial [Solirubrobacteraceae bacterium]|nr:ATP-grasp domain-containing protein [Solirubrobacteraceae bacterium]